MSPLFLLLFLSLLIPVYRCLLSRLPTTYLLATVANASHKAKLPLDCAVAVNVVLGWSFSGGATGPVPGATATRMNREALQSAVETQINMTGKTLETHM